MYFYDNVQDGVVLIATEGTLVQRVKVANNPGHGIVSWFGTGNTFPGVYDALGRFMFVGTTLTF